MRRAGDLISTIKTIRDQAVPIDFSKKENFIKNLVLMWQVIVASEPLLERAVYFEPIGRIRDYFMRHLVEESGHAEWLHSDLMTAGVDPCKALLNPDVPVLVGSQYYHVFHGSPATILGYMAVLECFPLPIDRIEEFEAIHGKPLCRTLRYHCEHDPDHGKDILELFDEFSEIEWQQIKLNAIQTAFLLNKALERLV